MKKILALLFLSISLLTGCNNSGKVALSFGSIGNDSVVELNDSNIIGKLESENLLIVTYKENTTCACWKDFNKLVLKPTISEHHLQIYSLFTKYVDNDLKDRGFKNREDAPTFYIVENGKVAKRFDYEDSTGFYSSPKAFFNEISLDCYLPKMFYCTQEYLDEKIKNDDKTNVFIMRSGCGDCKKVIPNILTPYFKDHDGTLLTLDIEPFKEDEDNYQAIKDHYHLSKQSDDKFGYSKGVVPTFQVYKKGVLTDACVYLNDSLSNDNSKIVGSYYDTTRSQNLPFMNQIDASSRVLVNKEIPSDIREDKEKVDEFVQNLHLPIITGFLNNYFN